eukprot:scaffold574202_cov71-Attheya_sp.AAC.1
MLPDIARLAQFYWVAATALVLSSMSIRVNTSFMSPAERGHSCDFIFGMNSNCQPTQLFGHTDARRS